MNSVAAGDAWAHEVPRAEGLLLPGEVLGTEEKCFVVCPRWELEASCWLQASADCSSLGCQHQLIELKVLSQPGLKQWWQWRREKQQKSMLCLNKLLCCLHQCAGAEGVSRDNRKHVCWSRELCLSAASVRCVLVPCCMCAHRGQVCVFSNQGWNTTGKSGSMFCLSRCLFN